ncbi:MAG: hypothetical protein U0800_14465 [Isosphaeraceae bacterium]
MSGPDPELRPSDLARLLLAGGDEPPRARARDQQADRLGIRLRSDVLNRLAAIDPEPMDLDSALQSIVADAPGATGPIRAVCSEVRHEWELALGNPEFRGFLLRQALERSAADPAERKRKRDR